MRSRWVVTLIITRTLTQVDAFRKPVLPYGQNLRQKASVGSWLSDATLLGNGTYGIVVEATLKGEKVIAKVAKAAPWARGSAVKARIPTDAPREPSNRATLPNIVPPAQTPPPPPPRAASQYLARERAINERLAGVKDLAPFLCPYLGVAPVPGEGGGAAALLWRPCGNGGPVPTLLDYLEGSEAVVGSDDSDRHQSSGGGGSGGGGGVSSGGGGGSGGGLEGLAAALHVPPSLVCWEVLGQLALALAHMHQEGVVSRNGHRAAAPAASPHEQHKTPRPSCSTLGLLVCGG